jgi:hypothetical protein
MSKRSQFAISNGPIGLELDSNGRGYSYMYAKGRHGFPIDLTPWRCAGHFFTFVTRI